MKSMRGIIALAIAFGLPILANTLVNPSFWASIPFGNKYVGMIKIGIGIPVAIFFLMASKKD